MPEPDSASPAQTPNSSSPTSGPTIRIGEEFGTAKRNLPPIKILLLALAGVLIIAALFSFTQRATPQASGTILNVAAVQIPNQNAVLVAFTFSLRSTAGKSLWIKGIQGSVVSSGGTQTGDALSSSDFDRYYHAFPDLSRNTQPPLSPEDKMQPGENLSRTILCSFPISLDSFNHRQSVSLKIQAYDQQLPIVLTE